MSKPTFRIHSVSIEGFKAFTTQQTFDFEGRNVFLFGQNGLGKTSIVEALRWCLFGLATQEGEIVRNQFYGGPCIVEIGLMGTDGLWTMRRQLRSSGSRSDQTIRAPDGSEKNLEYVFPQLSRIGPREGTHVIYAAQQPSSRRPEANITDFRYVVYRYLGVEEVPRLSETLLTLSREWEVQEKEVQITVEKLGQKLSEHIIDIDQDLARITSDPPWGDAPTPTTSRTRQKIDQLAEEAESLGASCSKDEIAQLPLREKTYEIRTAITGFLSGTLTDKTQKLYEINTQLSQAQSLADRIESTADKIADLSQIIKARTGDLEAELAGVQIEELENQLRRQEANLKTTQLKLEVVRASIKYLDSVDGDSVHEMCPTCGQRFQLGKLKAHLQDTETDGDHDAKEILEHRDQLKKRVSEAKRIDQNLQADKLQLAKAECDLAEMFESAVNAFEIPSHPILQSLRKYISELRNTYKQLKDLTDSQGKALKNWNVRIDNLEREIRFHELRDRKERLRRMNDMRFDTLHDDLKGLEELRDIVDDIRKLLNVQLHQQLEKDLPPLAQEMTDVFLRLTGNPTFDSIEIRQGDGTDGTATLDLRVSSSRGSGSWDVERGILNGQALNAIQLVPYFVFSRYQDSPLLDLLLLDDPTQAFDTTKIRLLLTELAKASSHATLFIATHEEDRFLPYLNEFFGSDGVKAYRAVRIDENGPEFEDVSITI